MKSKIPLCFYPTQIVFVDDNRDFLDALSTNFSKQFNVKTFDNCNAALRYINEYQREAELVANGEKPKPQGDTDTWVKQVLTHKNVKRFDELRIKEVSVLIVDYSMPNMDGIEFCAQINNLTIKKILLTGYATPADAVRAFNNNTIHYYLKKNDANMLQDLEAAIHQLQHAYFNELSSSLKTEAIDSGTPFFADPQLARYFEEKCESLGVTEYYYLTNPSRFALRTRDGGNFSCVIYTEDDIAEHLQILREESAPHALYSAIESRQYIPLFRTADGYYEPRLGDATTSIYPAVRVAGAANYYCAIIGDSTDKNNSTQSTGTIH